MGKNIKLFGSSGADRSEKKKKTVGRDTASFEAVFTPSAPPPAQGEAEKKPAPKPKKGLSAGKKAIIIIASVLAALCAATAALGFYVSGTETIFPKVSLFGVSVGNMTTQQAQTKLIGLGWDETEGEVSVALPMNRVLSVKAKDVGAYVSSQEAAVAAYNYCHGGNIFQNLITWLKCAAVGAEINVVPNMDEAAVREAVEKEVAALIEGLSASGVEVKDEAVLVVKGASAVTVDEAELTALVTDALRSRSYGEVEYQIQIGEAEPLDVEALYESVHTVAADAVYDPEQGGVVESVIGRDFDKDAAKRLWDAAQYGDTVVIPLEVTEPELTTEALEAMLFRDELSTSTTYFFSSTQNRIGNISLVADILNGLVMEPGDVFSYNGTVGQRTEERGFKSAAAYSGGEVVQEIGGGICQVSSTLYHCSLLANLEIVDRTCHYFPIGYLPPGLDATVSWKVPDFKFKNNRDYPIRIEAEANDEEKALTISIIGTDVDGSYVQMTYASWAIYGFEEYPELATGYKTATYRNVYDKDGNLISRQREDYSQYHYHVEDLDIPSPSPSASPPAVSDQPPAVSDVPPIVSDVPPAVTDTQPETPPDTPPEAISPVE